MSVDTTCSAIPAAVDPAEDSLAIEVRGVEKTFRLPGQKIDSLKERVLHPRANRSFTTLRALDGLSFDVRKGEFFGIVGRNGSGKSTLLKILASIYRADAGRIRMAGRLAPFIELGVGFNMELTARENVQLNGVMMGLSRREAAGRLSAVLKFAELEEFVDLKLKNYSSGMLVRLAFSVMVQADADILLIDEVLAVGDAGFQQKCAEVFKGMRDSGKTVVLVTHDMGAVQAYCHRALLIEHGKVVREGNPSDVGREYMRLNFEERAARASKDSPVGADDARLLDIWLEDERGERVTAIAPGEEIRLRARVGSRRDIPSPYFGFLVTSASGADLFTCGASLGERGMTQLPSGQEVMVEATVRNNLAPGHYTLHFSISRGDSDEHALWAPYVSDFAVSGSAGDGEVGGGALFMPEFEASATIEPEGEG